MGEGPKNNFFAGAMDQAILLSELHNELIIIPFMSITGDKATLHMYI